MADIDFYQDDFEDTQGDDGIDEDLGIGDDFDGSNPDDLLTPVQKMEKYMDNENIFSRQMVARSLMETIRSVGDNKDEANTVMKAMVRLSDDSESTVRAELMEQVPHIAMYCHENKHLFDDPIPTYILPIITKYLTDTQNQVRKTSQAALLVLLEQGLVLKGDFEEQVCPVLMDLSSPDSVDDFRTEAVALMSKMAPLVGRDITERIFMPRYAEMCTDALFHVRKVCASNFGDMCAVVGQENVEEHLLGKFMYLCEDGVWGVRKACAECFMAVSCACSIDIRKNELAGLFINLICDQSRWVRMAAFQALGGFISTFADPSNTGLYFNEDGMLVAGNADDFQHRRSEDEDDEYEESSQVPCATEEERVSGNHQEHPSQQGDDDPSRHLAVQEDMVIEDIDTDSSNNNGAKTSESKDEVSPEERRALNYQYESPSIEIVESSGSQSEGSPVIHLEVVGESSDSDECLSDTPSGAASSQHSEVPASSTSSNSYDNDSPSSTSCPVLPSEEEAAEETGCDNASPSPAEEVPAEATPSGTTQEADTSPQPDHSSDAQSQNSKDSNSSPVHVHLKNIASFNSFQYWRTPLPEIDLDFDVVNDKATNIHITTTVKDQEHEKEFTSEIDVEVKKEEEKQVPHDGTGVPALVAAKVAVPLAQVVEAGDAESDEAGIKIHTASVSTMRETAESVANIGSTHVLGQHVNETTMTIINGIVQDVSSTSLSFNPADSHNYLPIDADEEDDDLANQLTNLVLQDVIPQSLLDHYLSMTDPSRAQTVETDIARHCAYSLPAVAYTLGRRYWPCLRELYDTLAADMQWKVRRTLAFSIHQMAVILGQEITHVDLLPIFNGFLKDLDEVRIGVLKHLADFLRILRPEVRKDYLSRIPDFLNTDNTRNWRFREELAVQLILVTELYTAEEMSEHLSPVALMLAEDKVSQVRHMAFTVLSGMLRRLSTSDNECLVMMFVSDIIDRFALSKKWSKRQIFAQVCEHILDEYAMESEQFAKHLLPSLLALGSDAVPNVRIALAKTLSSHIIFSDYFTSAQNPHHEDLLKTIQGLQSDSDRDVRFFITRPPHSDSLSMRNMIPV